MNERRLLLGFEARGVAPGARAVCVHHVNGMKRVRATNVQLPADVADVFKDVRIKSLDSGDWFRVADGYAVTQVVLVEEFGLFGTMFELSATNCTAITRAFRGGVWTKEAFV